MRGRDTTLGDGGPSFPETTMGFARGLREASTEALTTLCRRYWKPTYSYLRVGWSKSNEDAKDLTQSFFLDLLEGGELRAYDPARGGFRAFLKTLLRRFAAHDRRDSSRLKRGGGARTLSFDGDAPLLPELEGGGDPERAFERVWLEELTAQALGAVRARLPEKFRVYEAAALGPEAERPSAAQVGERLGLGAAEVEKSLWFVREAIRAEMRASIARDAGGDRELEDEWRRLLGG